MWKHTNTQHKDTLRAEMPPTSEMSNITDNAMEKHKALFVNHSIGGQITTKREVGKHKASIQDIQLSEKPLRCIMMQMNPRQELQASGSKSTCS